MTQAESAPSTSYLICRFALVTSNYRSFRISLHSALKFGNLADAQAATGTRYGPHSISRHCRAANSTIWDTYLLVAYLPARNLPFIVTTHNVSPIRKERK